MRINARSGEGHTLDAMARFARPRHHDGLKNRRGRAGVLLGVAFWLPSALAAAAPIDAPAALTQYRCYVCHSDREALAGPALADVAARYRGRKDAVSHVARKIETGVRTGGPWHMPPHPEVSRDEARAMARYIMSLKARAPAAGPAQR
jgi:cytochrome c